MFGGETADNYYDEGLTASMKGDLEAAVDAFQKAIRLDNRMSSAYHQLGKCYLRMGQADLAVQLLTQVVQKRPENASARLDLAFSYLSQGNTELARTQFDAVQQIEPNISRLYLGRAQASFAEGDWQNALAESQRALERGTATFGVLYMLGRAAKLVGNLQLAENTLKKADGVLEKSLEVDDTKPEPHFLRGEVAFVQEKFTEALEHYKSAAEKATPGKVHSAYGETFAYIDVLAKKGLCLQRLGQTEQARTIGKDIENIDPNHALGKALRDA